MLALLAHVSFVGFGRDNVSSSSMLALSGLTVAHVSFV